MDIGRNDKCPCGSGIKFKKCCMLNKIPKNGVLRIAYEDAGKVFSARMFFQILNIRDFIYDKENNESEYKEFDKKHEPVFQNLYEALIAKNKCLSLMKDHRENVITSKTASYNKDQGTININEAIHPELNMMFKDFFIRGNIALKALVKLCGHLGFNMSFAFTDDDKFETKKSKFLKEHPEKEFIDYCKVIEEDRKNWYKIFIFIRNAIEHDGFKLPEINYRLGPNDEIKVFYPTINNQTIEEILEICWTNLFHLTEEMIIFLMSRKLKPPLIIVRIPEDKRDPNHPVQYKISAVGLPF